MSMRYCRKSASQQVDCSLHRQRLPALSTASQAERDCADPTRTSQITVSEIGWAAETSAEVGCNPLACALQARPPHGRQQGGARRPCQRFDRGAGEVLGAEWRGARSLPYQGDHCYTPWLMDVCFLCRPWSTSDVIRKAAVGVVAVGGWCCSGLPFDCLPSTSGSCIAAHCVGAMTARAIRVPSIYCAAAAARIAQAVGCDAH